MYRGENIGDVDYDALAGEWYLDGDQYATSVLEIRADGGWSLMELLEGDSAFTAIDWGTIQPDENGEGHYYAVSDNFMDAVYGMTVVDSDVLYWGGENDYYQKLF